MPRNFTVNKNDDTKKRVPSFVCLWTVTDHFSCSFLFWIYVLMLEIISIKRKKRENPTHTHTLRSMKRHGEMSHFPQELRFGSFISFMIFDFFIFSHLFTQRSHISESSEAPNKIQTNTSTFLVFNTRRNS